MTLSRPAVSKLRLMVALDRRRRELEEAAEHVAAAEAEVATLSGRLVERQAFDQAILDAMDSGIVTTDAQGRVTFVNRAARELLGIASGVGGAVADLFGLHDGPAELLGDASRRVLSYPFTTHCGVALDLELTVCADRGSHEGFFFLFRDTREEKRRSAERERFERLASIGTMVAGFAHEVRNPVAALRSLAESLDEDLADAGLELPHVSRMLQVLERIERLVRTSLQFGRPAAPRRARHFPSALVDGAVSEMAPRLDGASFALDLPGDLAPVYVDDAQIVQVLVILLNNALDAVGTPSRVLVRGRLGHADLGPRARLVPRETGAPERAVVYIEVRDDGAGIAPENLSRIFDPFFTTKASGTGLGLSIAQQIVGENGGAIEVTSTRAGTSFVVTLPIADG